MGNRTQQKHGAPGDNPDSLPAVSLSYNGKNQLTSQANHSYGYDANGHTIERVDIHEGQLRKTDYVYDLEQRLIAVKEATDGSLSEAQLQTKTKEELKALAGSLTTTAIASYTYNAYGQRVSKTVAGVTIYYLYNHQGLAGEYDANGNLIVEYHYKPQSTWMTEPVLQRRAGVYYYYQNDHLDTPQRLFRSAGKVVWEARYEAFGEVEIVREEVVNHLRFPGQYYDGESGTYYNYYRDYEPGLGRYLQSDPIGLAGGINTYLYGYGNPLVWFDLFGLSSVYGDPGGNSFGDTPGRAGGSKVCRSWDGKWVPCDDNSPRDDYCPAGNVVDFEGDPLLPEPYQAPVYNPLSDKDLWDLVQSDNKKKNIENWKKQQFDCWIGDGLVGSGEMSVSEKNLYIEKPYEALEHTLQDSVLHGPAKLVGHALKASYLKKISVCTITATRLLSY